MALEFDGISANVIVADTASLRVESGNATWSFWFKADDAEQNTSYSNVLLDKEQSSLGGVFAYVQANSVRMYLGDGGTVSGTITINNDIWYHVAIVKSDSSAKTYINSVEDIDGTWDSTPDSSGINLGIGDDSFSAGREFDGTIDEVMIFSRALSLAEIRSLYHNRSSLGIDTSGLVLYLRMNEKPDGTAASGADSVIDLSSSGNDGTPSGNPVYRAVPTKILRPMLAESLLVGIQKCAMHQYLVFRGHRA